MIAAKVVADSISPSGCRLTTFECVVPKWLIAEINTHAMIRRNSASSRAVPTVAIIERVLRDPWEPLEWRYRSAEGGMQAGALMSREDAEASRRDWLGARDAVLPFVRSLEARHAAKEHVNRLLEAWMWSVVVMTATEWDQYLHQRGPGAGAQPEFQQLVALQMDAFERSIPVQRPYDRSALDIRGWHLPYVSTTERMEHRLPVLAALSAARCAGVSYYRPGAIGDLERELDRASRLVSNGHWSPLDMPAAATGDDKFVGPLRGWRAYRKFFGGESGSKTHGTQEDAPWIAR